MHEIIGCWQLASVTWQLPLTEGFQHIVTHHGMLAAGRSLKQHAKARLVAGQRLPGARRRACSHICRTSKFEQGNEFADELRDTAKYISSRGKGILASDESNATTGKRLASVGVENTEDNRRAWRQTLYTAPGLGQYISGAIMFEETLYQSTKDGKPFVDVLGEQGIKPGIKVDTGLQMLPGTNGETSTQGLDGLGDRMKAYRQQVYHLVSSNLPHVHVSIPLVKSVLSR